MGKFSGVLLASDYDNTLVYTESALLSGGTLPPLSHENREALTYFMAEGGIFSVATGRALPSFAPIAPTLPMNGPTILFNGAALYDFSRGKYLCTAFLPDRPGVSKRAYNTASTAKTTSSSPKYASRKAKSPACQLARLMSRFSPS